jgi:hypothetical protein
MKFVASGYCPLHKRGRKGLPLKATKGVLGAMPFVVLVVLGVAMVLSLVFMMYVLARPWL